MNKIFTDSMGQIEKLKFGANGIDDTHVVVTIRKKDGTELFRDLGGNVSLIGGIQDYVKNMWGIQSSDLITIGNLDSEFTGLPTPNYTGNERRIFGYGLATDGASGSTVHVVKRHSKGYDKDKLISFVTVNTALDDKNTNMDKYAFRVEDAGDTLYYIKKIVPEYSVISAKAKTKIPDNPDTNYNGIEDVRAQCRIRTTVEKDECIRHFGKKYGTTDGAHFNSIILFAGRPCTVTVGGQSYTTYRDIIATNKINFKNIQLNDTEVVITYDIYFV